jgi:type II secretion system protein J
MTRARRTPAFTLVELIVALTLTAVAAGSVALVLSNASRTRDGARGRIEAFTRAELAANLIATDATNSLRDSDLYFTRVVVKNSSTAGGASQSGDHDELLLMTHIVRPTRSTDEQPESDEAEVQYRVIDTSTAPDGRKTTGPAQNPLERLWRRVDAGPDDVQEAGGVASPVVDGIIGLSLQASDGESWYDEWDSDYDGLPHALRVTVTARDDAGRYQKFARRTIAFDRPPLVGTSVSEESAEQDDASGQSTTGTSGSNSSSGTTSGSSSSTTGGSGRTGGTGGGGGGTTPR